MSSVQIRPPRFISPSRKVRTLRLGFFIGACDPRVRASRFIPRHSLLPASQSTCGHSLATQSAPSVAPKVVKPGRPDSFRHKFFFVQSTNFAPGLFHWCVRSARARVSLHPASLTPARKVKALAGTRSRRSLRRLWRPRSSNPAAPIHFASSSFLRKVQALRLNFLILSATHALRKANFPPIQAAGRYAAPRSKMMNHVGAGIKKAMVIPPIMWTTPITTAKIIL